MAVHSYFLSSVIGRQFIISTSDFLEPFRKDYHVPLYPILEFVVYMGWLKVVGPLLCHVSKTFCTTVTMC